MKIRLYESRDLEPLLAMWHETKRVAFPYVAVMQQYTLDDDRGYFQNEILRTCEVWVAEAGGEIIGLLALDKELIDQLFVHQDRQRRGVGAALLAKARERSPEHLRLFTFEKNESARAFYERHGFRAINFQISPPPESEPDVEYEWRATE